MTISLWRRVLSYLAPHRRTFVLASLAGVAFAALDAFAVVLLIPFLRTVFGGTDGGDGGGTGAAAGVGADGEPTRLDLIVQATVGRFVDLDGDARAAVAGIIVAILLVVAVKNVVDFLRSYLNARVEQSVMRDLRNRVYEHILRLDLAFFGRTRTGQVISRLTHDVELLRTLVTTELAKGVQAVLVFLAFLAAMLGISVRLTLVAFIVVPVTMVIWGPLVKRLRRRDRKVLELAGEVASHLQETVSGIRLVKSASAEQHERERFWKLTAAYLHTFLRTAKLRALAGPVTETLVALGTAVLLWYGARLVVVEGSLAGEDLIGFILMSTQLYAPVKYLSKLPALVQPGLVGAERLFAFLDAPVEIVDREDAVSFPGVKREIRYRAVHLAYREGQEVLRGIDVQVAKGSVVALVGPSGAGKTSVVDLLARFYDPSAGAVEIDGTDVRDFQLATLRQAMGLVSQDTVLFHDTVRANIAYGNADATLEQVEKAARAAHAHDFVVRLPEGYDTVVGERGTSLSGGQRQRIAIARAILRDPPILVLDEATSALDADSERLVQEAIEQLLEGRTVFVIAHRLSTVRRADTILVVDDGRLVQQGSHEQLMQEEGGLYRRLRELQLR